MPIALDRKIEIWRYKGQAFDASLTHFHKSFDCLYHKLLIPKPIAYRFSLPALKLVYNYL